MDATRIPRLWHHARRHRRRLVLASVLSTLNKVLDVVPELLIGVAIDVIVRGDDSFRSSTTSASPPTGTCSSWRWPGSRTPRAAACSPSSTTTPTSWSASWTRGPTTSFRPSGTWSSWAASSSSPRRACGSSPSYPSR